MSVRSFDIFVGKLHEVLTYELIITCVVSEYFNDHISRLYESDSLYEKCDIAQKRDQ